MSAFTLCQECGSPTGGDENAHLAHDVDRCGRFLDGRCTCDGWVCQSCCPDEECGPLARFLEEARAENVARCDEWERNLAAADAARARTS